VKIINLSAGTGTGPLSRMTRPRRRKVEFYLPPPSGKQREELEIPIQRVNTIIRGKRGVSAETAILLSRFFKMTPEFWMNLQTAYLLVGKRGPKRGGKT